MGLKLDDPVYEEKVKGLDTSQQEKADFYRSQIVGEHLFSTPFFIRLCLTKTLFLFLFNRSSKAAKRPAGGDKDHLY